MKRFKNLCATILAISLTLNSASVFAQNLTNTQITKEVVSSRTVKVTIGSKIANINEKNVTIDVEPYIQKNSSTMIPLRFVATALGINENNIKFDTVTKTVTIEDTKYSNTIEFYVNKNFYSLNGKKFNLDNGSTVEIKNGRTFVPFRTLGNAFKTAERNVQISWDAQTKTAIMKFEELGEKTTAITETTTQKQNNNTTTQTQTTQKQNNITTQKPTQATTQKPTQTTTERPTETTTQTTTERPTETTTQSAREIEEEVVKLVNIEREKNNLQPLEIKEDLMSLARLKSEDMKNNNYYDHTSPTYGSPFEMMDQFGISYGYAGENIAKGQITAEQVMNSWMNSKGHRENILNENYKYIGVGFADNLWTQMFTD